MLTPETLDALAETAQKLDTFANMHECRTKPPQKNMDEHFNRTRDALLIHALKLIVVALVEIGSQQP